MVKLTSILFLGVYTLFQAVSALPGPVPAYNDLTFTTTKKITTTRTTHTRPTVTATVTNTKTATQTVTTRRSRTTTRSKTTPTVTVTKTTTSTPTNTPPPSSAKCSFFDFGGPEYTDAAGKTYKIDCGFAIVGTPIASVSEPAFGSCFALCDKTSGCNGFTWTPGLLIVPAKCTLFGGVISIVPSLVTDSAVLV